MDLYGLHFFMPQICAETPATHEKNNFQPSRQDNLMKPSDVVASLGNAAVMSVVQSHPAIQMKRELKRWPNIWIAGLWDEEKSFFDPRFGR